MLALIVELFPQLSVLKRPAARVNPVIILSDQQWGPRVSRLTIQQRIPDMCGLYLQVAVEYHIIEHAVHPFERNVAGALVCRPVISSCCGRMARVLFLARATG